MLDGIRIIERVAARKASLKTLDRQWLDLLRPWAKGFLAFLSALAEDERSRGRIEGSARPRSDPTKAIESHVGRTARAYFR